MNDTYPYDIYDREGWLACKPPTQLGPALSSIVAEITSWGNDKKDQVEALFQTACTGDMYEHVWAKVSDSVYDHPIGEPVACTEITTISPWTDAISVRFGDGPAIVVQAVAARDHDLISANDFTLLTDWWVTAGLPLPDRISRADRDALIEWWAEDGVYPPTTA